MTNGEKLISDFPYIKIKGQDEVFTTIQIDTTGTGTPILVYTEWWNAENKEPTTKNDLAQERYQDLIEYFGDEKVAKTILGNRKEFKAWLERLRWNVKRADELARELEQIKPTTKNDLGVDCISRAYLLDDSKYHTVFNDDTGNFEDVVYREDIEKAPSVTPQPCEDAVSRKAVINQIFYSTDNSGDVVLGSALRERIARLPSVTPQEPRKGEWVHKADMDYLDKNGATHNHFMCNKCGFIHDFIDGHTSQYNFCPSCGADMREVEE